MTRTSVQTNLRGGRLELTWPGLAALARLRARVVLTDGTEQASDAWQDQGEPNSFAADCGSATVIASITSTGALARIQLSVTAKAPMDVTEISLAGVPLVDDQAPEWLVYSGYQSWDASGIARLPEDAAEPHRSFWTAGLANQAGAGIAVSALSAQSASARFDATSASLSLIATESQDLEPRPLLWRATAGDTWRSDTFAITAEPDVQAALRTAAEQTAGRRQQRVPRGWLSWYHYGPWITHDDVTANAAAMTDGPLAGLGYEVVQVDDGWQLLYGDWYANDKFPGGLAAVAERCQSQGQRLGVWTAPFLVSAASELAHQAPDDWFVADPAGGQRATDPVHLVFGPMQVLDARNPAVQKHLEETFARLRGDGVNYFKIDFLYAGGYAGTRALRLGLEAIRRGTGEDAYILACGAPLLPAVGICDGCRIGRDTATPIFDFELGGPKPTLIDDEIAEVARNLASRHFLDCWFQLDPDVALVGGNLSLEQARSCVTFCALSGGPFFASDNLAHLPPERLGMLTNRAVLDLVGGAPARPEWRPDGHDRASAVWRTEGAAAAFNWGSEPQAVSLEVEPGTHLTDLWTGEDIGLSEGTVSLDVAAAGVRLIGLDRG